MTTNSTQILRIRSRPTPGSVGPRVGGGWCPSRRIPERRRRPEACMAGDPVASRARPGRDGAWMQDSNLPNQKALHIRTVAGDAGARCQDRLPGC